MNGKVTVKKERGQYIGRRGEKFWPQDLDLTVTEFIPRLYVDRKSSCSYHARRALRARIKEGNHCVCAIFSLNGQIRVNPDSVGQVEVTSH